jgi:hypothetical protein
MRESENEHEESWSWVPLMSSHTDERGRMMRMSAQSVTQITNVVIVDSEMENDENERTERHGYYKCGNQ